MVRRACISGFTMHVQSAWNTYELTDYFYNGTCCSQCTRYTLGVWAEAVAHKLGGRKTKLKSKFYTKQVLGVSMIFQITGDLNCFCLCERRWKLLLNLICNMEKKSTEVSLNSRDTCCSCFCWIAAGTLTNIVLFNDVKFYLLEFSGLFLWPNHLNATPPNHHHHQTSPSQSPVT